MINLRKANWLAGCGMVALLCVSCGTGTPGSPEESEKGQGEQQTQSKGSNSSGDNTSTPGTLPATCAQVKGENECGKVLGCVYEDGKCAEDTSLATGNCGSKSQDDCLKEEGCNYSTVLDRCFDNKNSGKVSDLPTTCVAITAKIFADPEKECNKTIGCKYNDSDKTCGEDKALTANHCGGKSEIKCLEDPKCTWGDIVQKCFDEASVVMPPPPTKEWNSCADVPLAICTAQKAFGCTPNVGATACINDVAITAAVPCAGVLVAATCNEKYQCAWSAPRNACLKKATLVGGDDCKDLAEAICQADPGCTWGVGVGVGGVGLCSDVVAAPGSCNAAHSTGVVANDIASCNKDMRCQWSGARQMCYTKLLPRTGITTCADLPVAGEICKNTFGCQENGNACEDHNHLANFKPAVGAPCKDANIANCQKNPLCQYSVVHKCLKNTSFTDIDSCGKLPEATCRRSVSCDWSAINSICVETDLNKHNKEDIACNTLDEGPCTQNFLCHYNIIFGCIAKGGLGDIDSCAKLPQGLCERELGCEFSVDDGGICTDAKEDVGDCEGYNRNQENCEKANCRYSAVLDKCFKGVGGFCSLAKYKSYYNLCATGGKSLDMCSKIKIGNGGGVCGISTTDHCAIADFKVADNGFKACRNIKNKEACEAAGGKADNDLEKDQTPCVWTSF